MQKQFFRTTKERTVVDTIRFDFLQFKQAMDSKPSEIWHQGWSSQRPFVVITEYNEDGFMFYCNGEASEEPRQSDAIKLYNYLKHQGLDQCYIKQPAVGEV